MNKPTLIWGLACSGCGSPILTAFADEEGNFDTDEYIQIFKSKELAEIAATDVKDEEGQTPTARMFHIRPV